MVYNGGMEFIETPIFTKWITQTISDDSYQELQKLLVVADQIFMLFAYSNKEQGDLTSKQKKLLGEYARGL